MVSGKPVVCFVEDDPNDIFLIGRALIVGELRVHAVFLHCFEDLSNFLDRCVVSHELMPDAIVTDLKLNGYSGFDVLKHVKSSLLFHNIPALILSSSELEEDRQRAIAMGAHGFICKPASNKLLANVLSRTLSPLLQRVACAA